MSCNNKSNIDLSDLTSAESDKAFELCSTVCGMREGKNINIVAAVLANIIAEKFTFSEVEILALFFNALAEDLETIVDTSSVVTSSPTSLILPQPSSGLSIQT